MRSSWQLANLQLTRQMTILAVVPGALACQPVREAPRVVLPLVVDARGIDPVTTDLGYEVVLSEARMVACDFEFTTAGELHAAGFSRRIWDLLVSPAWAHPGHYEGGEIIGEARGRFVVDWLGAERTELGTATLIVGSYTSVNFTFAVGSEDDALEQGNPLLGHTAHFVGTASRAEREVAFDILIRSPEDRVLVGAPFAAEIGEERAAPIGFELLTSDQVGGGTLFDGLDFVALDVDQDGEVQLGPDADVEADIDAYNLVHRTFQTHDHFGFFVLPSEEES